MYWGKITIGNNVVIAAIVIRVVSDDTIAVGNWAFVKRGREVRALD
jgi:acetyltransferase-like isoleucine patch superfamily enzyme